MARDEAQCGFYSRVGICRHGKFCSKEHIEVHSSSILKLSNIFTGEDLEGFLKDILVETLVICPIKKFLVVGNKAPHMFGTVFIQFYDSKDCEAVMQKFSKRWYDERPIFAELSPARDLNGICCLDEDRCSRGDDCNYVHSLPLPQDVLQEVLACK